MHAACTCDEQLLQEQLCGCPARRHCSADLASYLTYGAATCSRNDSLMISKLWVCSMYMVLSKKLQYLITCVICNRSGRSRLAETMASVTGWRVLIPSCKTGAGMLLISSCPMVVRLSSVAAMCSRWSTCLLMVKAPSIFPSSLRCVVVAGPAVLLACCCHCKILRQSLGV